MTKTAGIILGASIAAVATVAVAGVLIFGGIGGGNKAGNLDSYLELGNNYIEQLDYENAIIAYENALEIDPYNLEATRALAEIYDSLGDTNMAWYYYAKAVTLDPDNPEAYRDAAYACMRDDRNKQSSILYALLGYANTGSNILKDVYNDILGDPSLSGTVTSFPDIDSPDLKTQMDSIAGGFLDKDAYKPMKHNGSSGLATVDGDSGSSGFGGGSNGSNTSNTSSFSYPWQRFLFLGEPICYYDDALARAEAKADPPTDPVFGRDGYYYIQGFGPFNTNGYFFEGNPNIITGGEMMYDNGASVSVIKQTYCTTYDCNYGGGEGDFAYMGKSFKSYCDSVDANLYDMWINSVSMMDSSNAVMYGDTLLMQSDEGYTRYVAMPYSNGVSYEISFYVDDSGMIQDIAININN